jgi:hypothetical protein
MFKEQECVKKLSGVFDSVKPMKENARYKA